MAAVATSKGRVIAGSLVARVLAGKAANASPRYAHTPPVSSKKESEYLRWK
uniref:Predicted protein n=1 Tax=Hordeum vulgare subsp. vulgare TaxID=112509 RepID=F2E942_HORVV|nr:predicted protein [Hordeum vulgare subsp. vulgare]